MKFNSLFKTCNKVKFWLGKQEDAAKGLNYHVDFQQQADAKPMSKREFPSWFKSE